MLHYQNGQAKISRQGRQNSLQGSGASCRNTDDHRLQAVQTFPAGLARLVPRC